MDDQITDWQMQQFGGFVAEETGLHFPRARWSDLRRGIAATAREMGSASLTECARQVMMGPRDRRELESLVNHLTVGETYFFRERRSFEILGSDILPALIRARRSGSRELRIWSAACCTGEEAYSIAMVLRQVIPDVDDWNITLLATDINSLFLQKAIRGVFGQWSFRDAPKWLQSRYFRRAGEGLFEISPEIRRMVRFVKLNLANDLYPSPQNGTDNMDVIFCRNVLMYFTEGQARQVIGRLYRAQAKGGWLVVGPSEMASTSCHPYVVANCRGASLYQRRCETPQAELTVTETFETAIEPVVEPLATETQCAPVSSADETSAGIPLNRLAISLANQGKLAEALASCEQWIAADRLNSSSHYLRAIILQEQSQTDEAVRSLRTALYVDPKCVLAHVALGNIARNRGNPHEAARHLKNARKLLNGYRPQDVLVEFEGVTAARLTQIIDSLLEMEQTG